MGMGKVLVLCMLACAAVVCCVDVEQPFDPRDRWWEPMQKVEFDVVTTTYKTFMIDYSIAMSGYCRNKVRLHCVLPFQNTSGRPSRWVFINLKGRNGEKTTLAFRGDNGYLAGFTNQAGHWYIFSNKVWQNIIPRATRLKFPDDYGSMMRGGYEAAADLIFGKESTLQAISVLANYGRVSPYADHGYVKRALATMSVMFGEGMRFREVRATIDAGWKRACSLTGRHTELFVHYSTISCALLIARQNNWRWDSAEAEALKRIGIEDLDSALQSVHFVLWPTTCSQPITWATP